MKYRFLIASVVAGLLAGCGNDTESFAGARMAKSLVTEKLGALKKSPEAGSKVVLSRADIDAIPTPIQLVTLQNGKQGVVGQISQNQGVATWSTNDDVTISMRDGVIVATRGLGADLMAASQVSVAKLVSGGASYRRALTHLDGLDQANRTIYACNARLDVMQTIEIIQISYNVGHYVASCAADGTTFEDEYWIDSAQRIRKSKQWVSPEAGYLSIEDLRR